MKLHTLKPAKGSVKTNKRLGRGQGSGGTTAGRGHKGAKSRSGYSRKIGFEGGQMPIQRRIPKSGFRSRSALVREEIYLSDLNALDVDTIDFGVLVESGLIRFNTQDVKIIGNGEIKRAITVRGLNVTAGAKKAIEAAKGKVEA